jgi:hypothetical protein
MTDDQCAHPEPDVKVLRDSFTALRVDESDRTERVPPYNTEAEQGLLGAILCHNSAFHRVGFLCPEHFGNAVHGRIFAAIGKLLESGQIANPVTLKNLFDQDGALTEIGGAQYLARLAGAVVTIINAEDYGRVVHDHYLRRALISLGEDVVSDAFRIDLNRPVARIIEEHMVHLTQVMKSSYTDTGPSCTRIADWLKRDIAKPDFLLGEMLSTTSRMLLVAPTGLGKTNFTIAFSVAIAAGDGFLHWRGGEGPRRVLFIDGEMSKRLLKSRLVDAVRRSGYVPDTFHILCRDDLPDMPPLNTSAGQQFIDRLVESIGGADLIVFDNIQALLTGEMKEGLPWQQTLAWVWNLTQRNIGQVWIHHTGHNENHSYGDKSREWGMDSVMLFERVERPELDIALLMKFTKARELRPDNRADFEPAIITLVDDQWGSERGGCVSGKMPAKDRALTLLIDAVARHGTIPPPSEYIPPETSCVTEGLWRHACELGSISEGSSEAARKAFSRAAKKLLDRGLIGKHDLWVWPVRQRTEMGHRTNGTGTPL